MASLESKVQELSDDDWFNTLYAPELLSQDEIKMFEEIYQYQGFDRKTILRELKKKFKDPKEAAEAIIICAMKGPQRAALTKMRNGKTLEQLGIPASGQKGTKNISCQRITAATADLAAYFLKRMGIPKRIPNECPGWLQFPSAGSITMPDTYRQAHMDFSRRFSTVIGGVFNEQIYQQMINNSYLDERLKLFGDISPAPVHLTVLPVPAPTFSPAAGSTGPTKTSTSSATKRGNT